MGSIRIVYDMEGDILDVDFRLTGEKPQTAPFSMADRGGQAPDTRATQMSADLP